MKNNIVAFLILFAGHSFAQQIFITPFLGIKADIGRGFLKDGQYEVAGNKIDYKTYPVTFTGLSPLIMGFSIEGKWNKNLFSAGIIYDDGANSAVSLGFNTREVVNNQAFTGYRKDYRFTGVNVLKIPFSYKRTVYNFRNKAHPDTPRKTCINLRTGTNLIYIRPSNGPSDIISFGSSIAESGDTIELVSAGVNLNKKWSLSFDLGLDMDIYIKSKRRINLALYYEQGTRKLSLSLFDVYINNQYVTNYASYSRGSSIQFKLMFPICVYDKDRTVTKNQ